MSTLPFSPATCRYIAECAGQDALRAIAAGNAGAAGINAETAARWVRLMYERQQVRRETDYTVFPYRYRKGSVVVACPSPDGFRTRASRLAGTFGRYVNRAGGYVMSERQAKRFEELYREGWDACTVTRDRIAPKEEAPC